MRHVDEGTLHELIDGSLPPFERQRVEHHLGDCAGCRARLAEARALVLETAGLVEALDAGAPQGPAGGPQAAPRAPRGRLIPPPSYLAWAASVVLAVGVGVGVRSWLHPIAPPELAVVTPPATIAPAPQSAPLARDTRSATAGPGMRSQAPPPSMAVRRDEAGSSGGTMDPAGLAETDLQPVAKSRATYAAPVPARLAEPDRALALDRVDTGDQPAAPRRITLEEAVARLGGTIRLIDGLQPVAVERITGISIPGEHPDSDAVLVRYLDPQLGAVELTQQRAPGQDLAGPPATELRAASPPPAGRGQVAARAPAAAIPTRTSISWQDAQGFHLTLTAAAPVEALTALRDRVR